MTQWAFYREAADAEPSFTGPWTNWQRHGSILLSDGRGERQHTDIAVPQTNWRARFLRVRSRWIALAFLSKSRPLHR